MAENIQKTPLQRIEAAMKELEAIGNKYSVHFEVMPNNKLCFQDDHSDERVVIYSWPAI